MSLQPRPEFAEYHVGAGARRQQRRAVARRRADEWAASQEGGDVASAPHNVLYYGCSDETIRCINTCAATLQVKSPSGASVDITQRLAATLAELDILLDTADDDDDDEYSPFAAERVEVSEKVQLARDAYTLVLHDVRNYANNVRLFYEYAADAGSTLYKHGVPQDARTLRDMVFENILKRATLDLPSSENNTTNDDDNGLPTCYVCLSHESESHIGGHARTFVVTRPPSSQRHPSRPCTRHRVCCRDDFALCACKNQTLGDFCRGTGDVIHLNCLADIYWTAYTRRYREARHRTMSDDERDRAFPYVECPQCRGLLCIDRLQIVQVK